MIEIAMGGEAMLGRLFNQRLPQIDSSRVWGNAITSWNNSDLFICNLENTITYSQDKQPKEFNYKLAPNLTDVLVTGGIDFVSLANNHILDFGVAGLYDTIANLDDLDISNAGAGTLPQAQRPALISIKGIKIAIFSAANHYSEWAATPSKPGIWYVDIENRDWEHVLAQVRRYRPRVDVIIMCLHWGPNWQKKVDSNRKALARNLVAAGVDVIHGHSPHHLQYMERINHSLVTYSLGGLINDYQIDKSFKSDIGAVVKLIFEKGVGIKAVTAVPVKVSDLQVNLARGSDARFAFAKLRGKK